MESELNSADHDLEFVMITSTSTPRFAAAFSAPTTSPSRLS
jgi:hypothetical protein